jgi:hypothetical protein
VLHIKKKYFFKFILISVYFFFLEKFIDVKDVDEKEMILKSLKNIAINTKEQCIALLNDFSISTKILCFLPIHDRSDMNIEVANEILNLLIKVSEKLFDDGVEKECIQFTSKLEECDCFNTLLFLLNIYENISFKVRISIILGKFYTYIVIPNEGKIVINTLINYLKKQSIKKSNEDKNNELMVSVLFAFVNITFVVDENKKVVLDSGIIPLLLPLVSSSDTNVCKKTVLLLSHICAIKSVRDKNSIIICGIFDVFHKKLLEISPIPPQKMISSNYYSIFRIIAGIDHLLISNSSVITSFLKTPLIPLLLHTLNSTIPIGNTSSDEDIGNIQLYICRCFSRCTYHCYKDTLLLVEMKVIDSLLNIIEMYINEIKEKKIILNEETIESISKIFFKTGFKGSTSGSEKEKNKFKNYFDENNRLNVLVNLFKYLISQTLSPTQKETINNLSVGICFLLKNERPPLCYGCVLEYVNNLKSSPFPTSDYYFSLVAKSSWDEMLKADECLWSYLLKEIVVVQDFEVENGLLGLDRDVYLSIVKFLDSFILRKVLLNIFFFLNFLCVFVVYRH